MTARERVLIGLTTVTLVGAGIGLLLSARDGEDGGAREPVMDAEAFAARTRAGLDTVRLAPAERAVLDTARMAWTGKPFAASAGPDPVRAVTGPAAIATYTYSAFVQSGGQRFAIVNGREYGVNDTLEDNTGVVEAIEADHVVLRFAQDGGRQVIPFKDPFLKGE